MIERQAAATKRGGNVLGVAWANGSSDTADPSKRKSDWSPALKVSIDP